MSSRGTSYHTDTMDTQRQVPTISSKLANHAPSAGVVDDTEEGLCRLPGDGIEVNAGTVQLSRNLYGLNVAVHVTLDQLLEAYLVPVGQLIKHLP